MINFSTSGTSLVSKAIASFDKIKSDLQIAIDKCASEEAALTTEIQTLTLQKDEATASKTKAEAVKANIEKLLGE